MEEEEEWPELDAVDWSADVVSEGKWESRTQLYTLASVIIHKVNFVQRVNEPNYSKKLSL